MEEVSCIQSKLYTHTSAALQKILELIQTLCHKKTTKIVSELYQNCNKLQGSFSQMILHHRSQGKFICIVPFTIELVSKQLHKQHKQVGDRKALM